MPLNLSQAFSSFFLRQWQTFHNMKTVAMLCFVVVVLSSQSISATQYSVTDFNNHLTVSLLSVKFPA